MRLKFTILPVLFLFVCGMVRAQVIYIPKPVYTYKQNFDSLASGGTSSKLPNGWYIYENGSAANSTYTADSGASSTGDTYSYGHSGSSDRALGCLASSSLQTYIGAQFKNTTGYSINSIVLSFTIEQWRLGATGRMDSMAADVTTFATGLNSGFWVPLPLLNIHSPVTSGSTGQLDGNNPSNRKKFTYTLAGISVANGSSIWVRWRDINISGSNDGLAIDDFSLSVRAYIPKKVKEAKFPQTFGIPDTTLNGVWKGIALGPNYSSTGLNFQFKDSTGNITAISSSKTYGYTPAAGDSVAVYGTVKSKNYLTYIDIDSVGKISSGNTIIPKVVTDIANDTLESGLVRINKASLASGYIWDTAGSAKNGGFMTTVTNGSKTFNIWINKSSNIFGKTPPKFPFSMVGIVLQNSTSPTGGYYLWPRFTADFDTTKLPLYKIVQVRGQNGTTGVSDSAGNNHLITLKGRVYSPSFTKTALMFSLIDNTGAITVASASVKNYTPAIGDSVLVRGFIAQSQGLTEINADSVRPLKKSAAVLNAAKSTTKFSEATESDLYKFRNAFIVDSTKWNPSGTYFLVKYTNTIDTIDVAIFENTDLYKLKSAPKGKFNISGIGGQMKSSAPYTGGYQLWPRGLIDYETILPFAPVPLYKISQLKGYSSVTGIADSLNKGAGFIKGVVHSQNFATGSLQFSLIDNSGAITVYAAKVTNYTPAIGDSILLRGYVGQVNGLTEFMTDSIIPLTKGTWLQSPAVVTALSESTESNLVTLKNVFVKDTLKWNGTGTYFTVKLSNGTDSFDMRVYSMTDIYKLRPYTGRFNVTGIALQDDASSPYLGGYYLAPRSITDFRHLTQLYKIREVRGQSTSSGIADSAGRKVKLYLKGIVQSPNYNVVGLNFSMRDSTGSIFVHATGVVSSYDPVMGDSILVQGLIIQTNGLTQIAVDSISLLGNTASAGTPAVVTNLAEKDEATLVKLDNMRLVNPSQWKVGGNGFYVDIYNGNDTVKIFISNETDLYIKPAPKNRFNITGIVTQNKTAAPYYGGYYLLPRSSKELNIYPTQTYTIGEVKPYNTTTGIADSIGLYCELHGKVLSPNLSADSKQFYAMKDTTGAIMVSSPDVLLGYIPNVGDSIVTRGFVRQTGGQTWFDIDSVKKEKSGLGLGSPVYATPKESLESGLVAIQRYYLIDSPKWDTTGAKGRLERRVCTAGGADTQTVVVFRSTDLYNNSNNPLAYGSAPLLIIGVCLQEDNKSPYFGGYKIAPRGSGDIITLDGIDVAKNSDLPVHVYPNPSSRLVYINAGFRIRSLWISDITGKELQRYQPERNDSRIDISSLPAGVYLLHTGNGVQTTVTRIIKY